MLNTPVTVAPKYQGLSQNFQSKQQNIIPINFKAGNGDYFYKRQEEEKPKKKINWSNIAIIGTIAASVAIVFSVIRGGRGAASAAEKGITSVKLPWKDTKNATKKVASLDSKTTPKEVRENLNRIIDNRSLSPAAKKHAGIVDGAELIYIYGYSGTGKTYAAEQYAQATDAIYAMIKYPDLGSPYKDAASMKVMEFVKQVKEMCKANPNRKIVVCVDEGDALIRKVNDSASGAEEAGKLRAAALTGFEELSKDLNCKNLTLFMTSNYHPKNGIVDSTALKRFSKQFEATLGDIEQNTEMFKLYLKKVEAIKPEFYESKEFKSFIEEVTNEKYSNRELEKMADESAKIFASTLKGVPDSELKNYTFKIDFLKDAKALNGAPASASCESMKIAKNVA